MSIPIRSTVTVTVFWGWSMLELVTGLGPVGRWIAPVTIGALAIIGSYRVVRASQQRPSLERLALRIERALPLCLLLASEPVVLHAGDLSQTLLIARRGTG